MPALAPALAAVRCEGLTDGHDDDARRDDDRRTAPTARRVADDDTTSGAQQQQRCGKNALHGGLRIEFVDRAQCETDAARSRRGSITQLRASPWLGIISASRRASACVISRVAKRVALQQPSLAAARQLLSVAPVRRRDVEVHRLHQRASRRLCALVPNPDAKTLPETKLRHVIDGIFRAWEIVPERFTELL